MSVFGSLVMVTSPGDIVASVFLSVVFAKPEKNHYTVAKWIFNFVKK